MKKINLLLQLKIVNISFIFCTVLFILYPYLDINISNFFFVDGSFISEKYTFIKDLRSILKILMILIPVFCLFFLILISLEKSKKSKIKYNLRFRMALLGFVIGKRFFTFKSRAYLFNQF